MIGVALIGLVFYLSANHMTPSSFIPPGIILAIAVALALKFPRTVGDVLGGLGVIGFIVLLINFGDGGRALSSGTWYGALVSAPSSGSSCSNATSAEDAFKVVGQQATIEGDIVSTFFASSSSGQPTFLDFHDPYQGYFRVVIWGENRPRFNPAPESLYLKHHVCVAGTVQSYNGAPEIAVDSPSSIQIIR